MLVNLKLLKFLGLALSFLYSTQAFGKSNTPKQVCIAPISQSAVVDEMSGAPADQVGKPLPDYWVRVDNSPKVLARGVFKKIDISSTSTKHVIEIFAGNQLDQSFIFRASDYKNYPTVLLSKTEIGYQTWQLQASKLTCDLLK